MGHWASSIKQTQPAGRCSLVNCCSLPQTALDCVVSQQQAVLQLWHDLPRTHRERAVFMHCSSHFASQAHTSSNTSSSARRQRPERHLPTQQQQHRRPGQARPVLAFHEPEPEPQACLSHSPARRLPPPPSSIFLSLTATLPTLLAAAAFCHTDDLRYGCAFKAGLRRLYIYFRTVSLL